ncbi:TetR/AcrR family transcriptional regulator [Pseudonocardia sp. GCM10023141]|uniref:TetR/AcrR family transcriptional regulator n=1 Tax=Pseudonocardia sp. GCM10023141 TaxID=3252653 RepID=UPI003616CE09
MARPRTHDLGALLDVAERIVTSAGPAGLTLRRLAAEAGISNGSIYHSFSSKEELLARVWARAARRFLTILDARVAAATAGAPTAAASATEAVVAAALSPVDFAIEHPAAARLFFMQRRDQLLSEDLPPAAADELEAVQGTFTARLITLAQARWNRRDRVAVDAIAACVVDVPGGLMQRKLLAGAALDEQTRNQIEAACRAILALELPPHLRRSASPGTPQEEGRR